MGPQKMMSARPQTMKNSKKIKTHQNPPKNGVENWVRGRKTMEKMVAEGCWEVGKRIINQMSKA